QAVATIGEDMLADDPERDTAISLTRAPATEIARRVQFEYLAAEADFEGAVSEIADPQAPVLGISRSAVPLALTPAEGQAAVNRWLAETRVGQDSLAFALPPSARALGAGDVVEMATGNGQGLYRIDRIEEAGLRLAEATRVDPEVYLPYTIPEVAPQLTPYLGPVPVQLQVMDLPLLTGDEIPHAPHIAASGRPWPGQVAVYTSPTEQDYTLDQILSQQATLGVLTSPLLRGPVGTWDRQAPVGVRLINGALRSFETAEVLAGAGVIAIGDGSAANWEVLQYTMVAAPTDEASTARDFLISGFLRGQAGTAVPDIWSEGSRIVLMGPGVRQLNLSASARGTAQHLRYGPADRPYDDPTYRAAMETFHGAGLRPYPVVHLRVERAGTTATASWIRQTRIDGDDWSGVEVPLGEDDETYLITTSLGGTPLEADVVTGPTWSGTLPAGGKISVAQISARYGPGPTREVVVA
ncbi:MAG: phage tail protein, partial [Pseudomonadota bacterium]